MSEPARVPRRHLALVAFVALLAFAPTLRFGLAYDDEEQIASNPALHLVENIPRAFGENVWAFLGGKTNAYRPLHIIAYTLIYQVWGASPLPYHALNVLLHAICSALVCLLVARLVASPKIAVAAGLLFALHPVHAETVAWSAALPDLLVTFFAILAAVLYARQSRGAFIGSLFATAAGLLSKEVGVMIPLLLAAQERAGMGTATPLAARRLPAWTAHAALIPIYVVARLAALGEPAPISEWRHSAYETILSVLARLGGDALRLLAPIGFTAFTPFRVPASPLAPAVLAGLAASGAAAFFAYRAFRARAPLLAALAWLIFPLLPSLYLPGLGRVVSADRYLYAPSVGFALLAALALAHSSLRAPAFHAAGRPVSRGAVAFGLAFAAYAVSTQAILPPWRDSASLYTAVLERSPDSAPMRLHRAFRSLGAGDLNAARADYQAALAADSTLAEAWLDLAIVEKRAGRVEAARVALEHARVLYAAQGLAGGVADALTNLAEIARAEGDAAAAESLLIAAIDADPRHAVAHGNLGALYAGALGRPDLALREMETAARASPWLAAVRENLAALYASQGRWEDAARTFREVLRLEPRSVVSLVRLGYVLERAGRPGEARDAYDRALRIDPANAVASERLAALAAADKSPAPR